MLFHFFNLVSVELFEHKKVQQGYKAQRPFEREIFYLTEITLQ